jgi:hypothetical protein
MKRIVFSAALSLLVMSTAFNVNTIAAEPEIIASTAVPSDNDPADDLYLKPPPRNDPESYSQGGWWNEKCQTYAYVNPDCTVESISSP